MIYVFLALLALVILISVLLSISVTLKVQYDKDDGVFKVVVHYLFLKWVLSPKDDKKKHKPKQKKKKSPEKKEKKSSFGDKIKSRGLGGFIEDIKDIVKGAWRMIVCVLRRAVLKRFRLQLVVAGEDAAVTAVLYGFANAVIYPIVSAILENVRSYKDMDVDITPDFSQEAQADFEFEAELKLRPASFVGAILESRDELSKLLSAVSRK